MQKDKQDSFLSKTVLKRVIATYHKTNHTMDRDGEKKVILRNLTVQLYKHIVHLKFLYVVTDI